jgi:uncharacterized membrane protein
MPMTHVPGAGHANRARSLAKTLSWRTIGTMDTIFIAFVIFGDLTAAAAIGFTEVFTKMILYYFHERAWSWSDWGLEDVPLETPESTETVLS